jgi:hypothetical protein
MPKLKYTNYRERWTWEQRLSWTPEQLKTRRAWLVHRSQARYRKEEYSLTWQDYEQAWGDRFSQKGRTQSDLTLVRIDPEKPWQLDNVKTMIRSEHCREQILKRHQEGTMKS